MSFNTRSGRGRMQQQAQLTYHQTPPRMQPNPLYSAQYSTPHFNPAPVTPTIVAPVPVPVPAPAAIPAPAQPSPPGVAPQPLPTQSQDAQSQPATPQQFKTLSSMVKSEGASPPASPMECTSQSGEKEVSETRPWKKMKNPSFKVNKVQKRRRLNARFRKLLFPKNAIMVLNELHPGVVFDASEAMNALSQISYSVQIIIDGEKYTGEGTSKAAAKAAAAELAVKGIILKKIAESSKKDDAVEEECMDLADDMSDKGSINGKRVIPEDEVPWGSLASFALFKLFAEWKTQGSFIPPVINPTLSKPANKNAGPKMKVPGSTAAATAIAAGVAASTTYGTAPVGVAPIAVAPVPVAPVGGAPAGVAPAIPSRPAVPDNAETLHPVTLVGRLFPGTAFTETARVGNPPNLIFTMSAVVNGMPYEGKGKSKKEAKKQCAIEILKLAGVPYNPN